MLGGGRGMGRAAARMFAEQGARIHLAPDESRWTNGAHFVVDGRYAIDPV